MIWTLSVIRASSALAHRSFLRRLVLPAWQAFQYFSQPEDFLLFTNTFHCRAVGLVESRVLLDSVATVFPRYEVPPNGDGATI